MSETWIETHPRARVKHRCDLCGREILPGETYRRSVLLDGTANTWKECAHCDAVRDVALDQWLSDDYTPDLPAEWEPTSWQQMRVKVQWLRGWRRRDGSLYPVPERIMHTDEHGFGWQVDVKAGVEIEEASTDPSTPKL